jgi:hypothetical protein
MRDHTRRPLSSFKRGSNVRAAQRSEAEIRDLGKGFRERKASKLTAGQLQGEDGTVIHVLQLQGHLEGIPFAKTDGV